MIKDLIRSGLILCFCFAISFICSCNHDMGPQLDVMTWNIWHGGIHGTEAKAYEEDTTNIENVLLVLEQNHSDVLLMQETYCCGMELAQRAGYEYSWRLVQICRFTVDIQLLTPSISHYPLTPRVQSSN